MTRTRIIESMPWSAVSRAGVIAVLLGGAAACSFSAKGSGGNGGTGSASGNGGMIKPPPFTIDGSAYDGSVVDQELSADGNNCGLSSFGLDKVPPDLLIVLDRSGTMLSKLSGHTDSKWTETSTAINQVVTQTQSTIRWGLKDFAFGDLTSEFRCLVPDGVTVANALDNAAAIGKALDDYPAVNLSATPTRWAIQKAAAYLAALTDGYPKYILLATDGLPNCQGGVDTIDYGQADEAEAIKAVGDSAAAGIPVFVVGIATTGSNAHDTLNSMAEAGERPRADTTKYFPVSTTSELVDALANIGGQISTCTFSLGRTPPDPSNIAVNGDDARIPRDTTHAAGWDYTDASQTGVELYGTWCDNVKSGAIKNVQAIFGCAGQVIP